MNVFDILQRAAPLLRNGRASTVTNTSTATTIVDTSLIGDVDDFFNGGFVLILSGTHIGKSRNVTDFVQSTGTLTIDTLGTAPAVGVSYHLVDSRFPRELMVQALNEALGELGPFDAVDETLVTTADTESYNLPAGVRSLKEVFLSEGGSPYVWQGHPHRYWYELVSELYFRTGHFPDPDLGMRLIYDRYWPYVSADTDDVSIPAPMERLVWETVFAAARMRIGESENLEPWTKELMAEAAQKVRQVRRIPIIRRPPTVRYSGY